MCIFFFNHSIFLISVLFFFLATQLVSNKRLITFSHSSLMISLLGQPRQNSLLERFIQSVNRHQFR